MKCESCNDEHDGSYGSGRFCSRSCANKRTYDPKRKEKIYEKVSKTLSGRLISERVYVSCLECGIKFKKTKASNRKFCSEHCSQAHNLRKAMEVRKEQCKNIEERNRLREIGRKGGFGKKGITKGGTRYESSIEKQCFEYLEENKIEFEPHKNIPTTSKVSDVYLPDTNLWIEIDGINREKKKQWLGKDYLYWKEKLSLYEELCLNLKVVNTFEEFIQIV